jgi:hypothetical protein
MFRDAHPELTHEPPRASAILARLVLEDVLPEPDPVNDRLLDPAFLDEETREVLSRIAIGGVHSDLRESKLHVPNRAMTTTLQDLVRAIDEDFDNLAVWHPLADWLIEQDDPRGELINIDLALENREGDAEALARRRAEILAESSPRLLGDTFARVIAEGYGKVTWRRGFVDEVAYVGDPGLVHLRAVGWLVKLMVANREPFSLLRALDLSYTDITDLSPLEKFPHLESLELKGCKTTKQSMEALRALRPKLEFTRTRRRK